MNFLKIMGACAVSMGIASGANALAVIDNSSEIDIVITTFGSPDTSTYGQTLLDLAPGAPTNPR